MKLKEFKTLQYKIEKEQFNSGDLGSPFQIALQRAEFVEKRLERLLVAANGIRSKTIERKVEVWKRQLSEVRAKKKRFFELATT
jgi:hypothetical protein